MFRKLYHESDVLTFANGMVGCVTKNGRIALVDKLGWATPPHAMPLLDDYLLHNVVTNVDYGGIDEDRMAA